jgi:ATP-binding cassette subfamily F protein 3
VILMLLKADHVYKVFNGETLLSDICLQIEDTDRIGLIGANGCGKSTLLKLLLGELLPDHMEEGDGQIVRAAKTSVGYLAQSAALDSEKTVREEMRGVFSELLEGKARMRELEHRLGEGDAALTAEYDRLQAWFLANDGYDIDVKIRTVLFGMGFTEEELDREISGFSGGEKTRLALCRLLLEAPNLLILDEPTNHLDFETIAWLEDYLRTAKSALLIVSHDRYFLDKLCTSICEIERGRLTRFRGNYSAYTVLKEQAVERQQKEYDMQQKEIAKLEDYVARNMARASTSKSAKSRQKQLDKMERIEKPVTAQKRAGLSFTYEVEPPLDVLEVRDADISVGQGSERKTLLSAVEFAVRRGEKLGIIGANGIGKSTLLKEILGILPHGGLMRFNKNVKLGYFDQESTNLNPLNTVIDELHDRFPAMLDGEIRSILGQVRITGEDVFKPISALSGGERARVCFALLMLEHANVMLLDEPTNHLDLPMKEVLEEALDAYTGTLLFVSHDRYFLKRLATQLLELTPDGAVLHPYGFEKYLEVKAQQKADALAAQQAAEYEKARTEKAAKTASSHKSKAQRSADAARRSRIRELEQEIEALDVKIAELEEQLTLPEVCTDYQKMQEVCDALGEARAKSEADFEELMELSD